MPVAFPVVATLFITCGLQAAGKTTLAKRLEQEQSALRLTADEWLRELHPALAGAELEPLRDPVERVQWGTAIRALDLGCNVVLDWGLWSRQERDHYRSKARALGARVVLCVLDPPIDERWERLSLRNVGLPDDSYLPITWAELEATAALFQRPTPEELALFDPL